MDVIPVSDVPDVLADARRFYEAGDLASAEQLCRRVLRDHPSHPDALHRLGRIAHRAGQTLLAVGLLRQAVAARPESVKFRKALGDALLSHGRPAQAIASYVPTLHDESVRAEAQHNTAIALLQQGRPDEAARVLREALTLAPDRYELHSNLLLTLQYCPSVTREQIFDESRLWAARHAAVKPLATHRNDANQDRKLRIGYVSADFRRHPVGYFLEPVLRAHDPGSLDVFCYSNNLREDEQTARLRNSAHAWRRIGGLDDTHVRDLIVSDAIDILIDLAGHTAGNRLPLFAHKPAPVQVTWAGYSDTTGMSTMDYFIGDRFICPEAIDERRFFTERVRRLPNYFLAYEPHGEAPDVSPAPVSHRGYITFGSFNALAKLNAGVLSVWADILNNVKGSRLLLKADGLGDSGVRQRVMQAFVERGVESERIVMERRSSDWVDYAAAYSQIDVALDPFPFNGGTTSMDGLWMGVPIVSLRGDRCVSRFGAGILRCLGLDDLTASTPAEYVETAVDLALNTERISTLRSGMRERMLNSALCDCVTFTRALEDLYRTMWRDWCQSH